MRVAGPKAERSGESVERSLEGVHDGRATEGGAGRATLLDGRQCKSSLFSCGSGHTPAFCAVECDEDGYRFETVETSEFDPRLEILQPDGSYERVDIRTLPFVRFDGNEAHCQRLFAINLSGFSQSRFNEPDGDVEGVGPDPQHPFVLRNTNIWDTHWAFHCGSPCVRIEGMDIHDTFYGIWRCVMHRHEYRDMRFTDVNTPVFFPRAMGEADYDYSTKEYFDLEPVDDLPPVTVITRLDQLEGRIRVRGVTTDNYDVGRVLVNGEPARALADNFAQWEIELPTAALSSGDIVACAVDREGNVEQMPHRIARVSLLLTRR